MELKSGLVLSRKESDTQASLIDRHIMEFKTYTCRHPANISQRLGCGKFG